VVERVVVVPVAASLTAGVDIEWPARQCAVDGQPVYCNAQLAVLILRLVTAVNIANEQLRSIQLLGSDSNAGSRATAPAD